MPRAPDVFVYRDGDDVLQNEMKPVKTAYFSDANIRGLKTKIDAMGASIQLDTLQDLMRRMYDSDDEAQRSELMLAQMPTYVPSFVERLNRVLLAEIEFRMRSGAAAFHDKFLEESRAFLGDDISGLYKFYDTEKVREDVRMRARNAHETDMFRYY